METWKLKIQLSQKLIKNSIMKPVKTIILILILFPSAALPITGDEALQKFKDHMAGIKTMKGQISLVYQNGEMFSGNFKYMFPGKIFIQLSEPSGKTIISNGKKLWAYDSLSGICGVQELNIDVEEDKQKNENKDKENKRFRIQDRGGPSVLLSGYQVTAVSEEKSGLSIELTNESRRYTEIKLVLNNEFMLIKAIFKNTKDEGFMIKLSEVKTGEKIVPGLFDFNVPANSQVVKNPLDIR